MFVCVERGGLACIDKAPAASAHFVVIALSGPSPCRMDFAHMYQVYKSRRGIKRSEDSKVGASLGTLVHSPSCAPNFQEKFACLEVG